MFRKKSIASLYVQKAILEAEGYLGLQANSELELQMQAKIEPTLSAIKTLGALAGSAVSQKVLGDCIWTYEKKSSDKYLLQNLQTLQAKLDSLFVDIVETASRRNIQSDTIQKEALRSFEYLASGRDPKVILESEMNLHQDYRDYREKVLNDVPISYLSKMFTSVLKKHLGISE